MNRRNLLLSLIILATITGYHCTANCKDFAQPILPTGAKFATVRMLEYEGALRNPLMGFTLNSLKRQNEWATLLHVYVPWDLVERTAGDSVDTVRRASDSLWGGIERLGIKVIPRVYLVWPEREKRWPADMREGDYSSDQFRQRVVSLVRKLGEVWDGDPRVAFVEMGIVGYWGEHHSPSPTPAVQSIMGQAFINAFPNKKVLVRHAWKEFRIFDFGEYWDSFGHYDEMEVHGRGIASLGNRWNAQIIGGEVAYNWGNYKIQAGDDPTDTVLSENHRNYIIDTIRWLHCTQLRWISDYVSIDRLVRAGAAEIQKAMGYRFTLDGVAFTKNVEQDRRLEVAFTVRNDGSAPFYYPWPVEVSLLDPDTRDVKWSATFNNVDIRLWLPGDRWSKSKQKYEIPPEHYIARQVFEVDVPSGEYVLALSILDPAGNVPSVRFANRNYWTGGRYPIGVIGVNKVVTNQECDPSSFIDPNSDNSAGYVVSGSW